MLAFVGCSGKGPSVDYDPSFEASKFSTFSVSESSGSNIDPLNSQRIRSAIVGNLRTKGYRYADKGDFTALYDVYVVKDVPSNFSFGFGIGSYSWHHGGGSVGATVTPSSDQVEIRIHMYDPNDKKVFWSAKVAKKIPDFNSPKSRESFFNAVVDQLLKDFPTRKRP
ncbi:DUF4136 domain-containing protein [Hydrogenimonas urashimensis]|uniref:DUF4136 domain-containing protein n=1 Tax=Hydrogenimonas urashimensis TaxID=2740515 RepID=UPI001914F950|nr:DUF4136 domain-containing protein [Hydrogenimonas urashimensis]